MVGTCQLVVVPVGHYKNGLFGLSNQLLKGLAIFYWLQLHVQSRTEIAIEGIFEHQVAVVVGLGVVVIHRDGATEFRARAACSRCQPERAKHKAQKNALQIK